MVPRLIGELAELKPDVILHSDMTRTRAIAEPLARRLGKTCIAEPLWRERAFGKWEGQSWNAIYQSTGNAMDGMIEDPEHFRPGGGETTNEVIARIRGAVAKLTPVPCIVIVSHGGPIACLRLILNKLPITALAASIPAFGEIVTLRMTPSGGGKIS